MKALKRSAAIAVAVHAGVCAVLVWMPVAHRDGAQPQPLSAADEEPIDVTIDESSPDLPEVPEARPEPKPESPGAVASLEGHGTHAAPAGATQSTARASLQERPSTAREPEAGSARIASPSGQEPTEAPGVTFGRPDIGVGGTNPFLARSELTEPAQQAAPSAPAKVLTEAEKTALANRRVQLSLREAAREHDHDIGLGPEGPVRSALGDATTSTTAPVTGRAVFFARADEAGMVTAVDVLECNGPKAAWGEAAVAALAALKTKKLRMPSSAHCAEMKIEVTSGWKMPNGHDPGTDVTAGGARVKKGVEGPSGAHIALLDPKVHMLRVTGKLVVPVPSSEIDLVATNGDASNLGAKPRRIVHTRVLDVKML